MIFCFKSNTISFFIITSESFIVLGKWIPGTQSAVNGVEVKRLLNEGLLKCSAKRLTSAFCYVVLYEVRYCPLNRKGSSIWLLILIH